jgi:hypothetical protein
MAIAMCVLIAIVATPQPAFAQAISTGTIQGTIMDPSGAVVPGAEITINDPSTSTKRTTVSNNSGHYILSNVPSGTYEMRITKAGFTTTVVTGQKVEVGKTLTEDLRLRVGQVAQEITVETTGTELQTTNATVGNVISGIALQSLPSLGRDVSTFVTLQPGVSPDGSVAGTVVDQSSFSLDGGQNTNDMDGSMSVYTPSFAGSPAGGGPGGGVANQSAGVAAGPTGVIPTPADSIEEFKVNTAGQTADFNSSSGAQVQMVTKRGTNSYHGTVYEYYLDNNLNANTWDNKNQNPVIPNPSYHYSRFGGSIGGTLLPKLLGGKTYFFANYQGFRWPNAQTIEKLVPSASMRLGLLYNVSAGQYINLNPGPVTFNGVTYPGSGTTYDPRGLGLNPLVAQLWGKMPLPNTTDTCALSRCDLNAAGIGNLGSFKANVAIPQSDNFGVFRIDHDFGDKWKFNATYHYYKLTRATIDQIDIGGALPGDTLGVPTSKSSRPQLPWLYTAGLTTVISSHVTNDFHYSFLRNWWSWSTAGDPAQLAGIGGALEPLGESRDQALSPYNVNTQQTRTRYWDGLDHYFRDDVSWLKGSHLFQFGGAYQHNVNKHERTDNGGGINYYPVYQLATTRGAGISGLIAPAGFPSADWGRDYAAVLGIVSASQQALTRSGPNLALNPPLTPARDESTIPYYNLYFSDSWKLKPTFTLTYGLGWTLEMPPTEKDGKQIMFVDDNNLPIDSVEYLKRREAAALQGQVYNPIVGFNLIGNTAGNPKYPYHPYYKEFSPRISAAWNPHFSGGGFLSKLFGEDKTVLRGGYGRIYGRLNGVDLVLVPLLGTGLIQPLQCIPAAINGSCGSATASTAFRIGVDGNSAPLQATTPTLPQPLFPGLFGNASAGAGEALDPNFRPNVVDSFTVTLQRQLSNRVVMEIGYLGRKISHEYQPLNINAVPHMFTKGGQTFASAYAAVEQATAVGTNIPAAVATPGGKSVPGIAPQPFFESALAGTGYCTGYANCTSAVVDQQNAEFSGQAVWDLWSALDNGGAAPGFNFPQTMLNTVGQLSSGVGVNASIGYGNYNAGFATLRMNDWHGLTMQHNFTWSKALGTGAEVQATSAATAVDPYDLHKMYGLQPFDRKFVYNMFMVYQPPWYKGQQGVMGRILGGWTFSPLFAAASGLPVPVPVVNGGGQGFGEGDSVNFFAFGNTENAIITNQAGLSASPHNNVTGSNGVGTSGTVNMFANPEAVFNNMRQPILGLDSRDGGFGVVRGLGYWNLDLSVRKNFKITERFNAEAQVIFTNVLNHTVFFDPSLDTSSPANFGVLNQQGNSPRQMEFGIRLSF